MITTAIHDLSVLSDTMEKHLLAELAWYFIRRDY